MENEQKYEDIKTIIPEGFWIGLGALIVAAGLGVVVVGLSVTIVNILT